MAELLPKERLQPSLLDRLTDDHPDQLQESRDRRVLSLTRLRQCVLRDLGWLFNASNLAAFDDDDSDSYARHSVINYGLFDLAGVTAKSLDTTYLEQMLRQVIWDFEPRILRHTVKVRAVLDESRFSHNALSFEIEGQLWAQPTPLQLYLKTELDLESGDVTVEEQGGR